MQVTKAYLLRCLPHNSERGQILLVIVLVMIVALTIGLSVVTRSVTNLQITSEEESSQRALSAAEAGIEKALQSGGGSSTSGVDLKNNSKIDKISVNDISGKEFLINDGDIVPKDDGADVWLAQNETTPKYQPAFTGANITVSWGSIDDVCANGPTNSAAALEVVVITTKSGGGRQITTYPLDPCRSGTGYNRVAVNNFCTDDTVGSCPVMQISPHEVKGKQFRYRAQIPAVNGVIARIVPLYASTSIAVTSVTDLPSQGKVIESLGSSGNTQRKISVYRGFGKIPIEFFPYGLFSP